MNLAKIRKYCETDKGELRTVGQRRELEEQSDVEEEEEEEEGEQDHEVDDENVEKEKEWKSKWKRGEESEFN